MKSSAPGVANAGSRRVQIFTASESFTPGDSKPLVVFTKPEAAKGFLKGAISSHYLFEELGDDDLDRIIDCMRPSFAQANEAVITQGELGDLFFCLESGSAVASIDGKPVFTYEPGGCFGELALIYNSPRAASVIASSSCKFWTLDLRTFRYILATTASSAMVTRCEFLKNCKFLDPLSNEQIGKVAGALDTLIYEDGDYIIKQGDHGDSFYIIEEGTVRCTQVKASGREIDLITLKAGDYFGEMALMLNDARHANCISVGKTRCLSLSRKKFDILLGSVQELLARKMRIRILQSVPLLAKLPESKLMRLSSVMRVQAFKNGAYIIRQGEEGSRFYIINEGEVRCTRLNPGSDKEDELVRLSAQEFFGERALITDEVRKANVIACGPVECLVLERGSFQSLLTEVQEDLVTAMTQREEAKTVPVVAGEDEDLKEFLVPRTDYAYSDLKIMRTVGTGTFGRVKMVQHMPSSAVCALKCMNKSEIISSHQERNIMAEKNLLFECSTSPFVLKLLQTYNSSNQIFMLMEFVQGGELWSYIYEKQDALKRSAGGGFEYPAVKFYAANVLMAFKHLHQKGIAYRDLKPENLLMNSNGYLKMIDFGFAKRFPFEKNGVRQDKTYTLCGTPDYLAPEIVMSKGYDKGVDYWAFGCFLFELYLARTPFQADYTTKIFQNIIASEKSLSFPDKMDPQHVALVKKLLSHNPVFRIGNLLGGIDDIVKDPFFSSVNWQDLTAQTITAPYVPAIGNDLDTSNFDDYEEESGIPEYSGDQGPFNGF